MGDGIKTLDLYLCATCLVRSVAHFDSIYLWSSFYCVCRQSHNSKIIYYLCSSKPLAVKVGLLFEYVLIGCTVVTESKYSWTTSHLEFHIARGISIFKSLVSEVDTIKACTLIDCVVAVIILQDLGVQHFGDENVHMLCFM